MVIIQNHDCLSVTDTLNLLTLRKKPLSQKTVYRWIEKKQIEAYFVSGHWYITKQWIETYCNNVVNVKPQAVVTRNDLMTDSWLHDKNNLVKLQNWNQTKYIHWADMKLLDYVSYYRYFILPIWEEDLNPNGKVYNVVLFPTKDWLLKHGFREFTMSFQKRYLKSEGIESLSSFWEYFKKV